MGPSFLGNSGWNSLLSIPTFQRYVFLCGSLVKDLSAGEGDVGLLPGLGITLEKETATHSSILAWAIPWTEEPGGLSRLQSTGL